MENRFILGTLYYKTNDSARCILLIIKNHDL